MEKINFVVMDLGQGFVTEIHLNANPDLMLEIEKQQLANGNEVSCYQINSVIDHSN